MITASRRHSRAVVTEKCIQVLTEAHDTHGHHISGITPVVESQTKHTVLENVIYCCVQMKMGACSPWE